MMKKIDTDITKAATLVGEFYASESSFAATLENVFSKNWQFITDDGKLKENNNAYPFQFLGDLLPEPLVLINNEGTINCFSNVCTHRGNILIHETCTIKKHITCGYHGKQFDTCGKFKFMPKIEGMQKQIVEMNSKLSASRFTRQIAQGQVGIQTTTNIHCVLDWSPYVLYGQ